MIKAYQGIRQKSGAPPPVGHLELGIGRYTSIHLPLRLCASAPLRLCAFALKPDRRPSIKAPIKAKNRAIVHHQGISRQRPFFWGAASGHRYRVPTDGAGCRSYRPEDIYWWGYTQACARGLAPAWAITWQAFSPQATADGYRSGRSIKAKTPVIVHDQGISRHTAKIRSASARWPPGAWHWEVHVHPSPFAPLRLCAFALKPDHRPSIKASIKAKNPAIVHHQGISRQTVKFRSAPVRWTPGAWNLELRLPRPSAFICGSSPGCGPCSRVWRISRLSSHWGYWRFSV